MIIKLPVNRLLILLLVVTFVSCAVKTRTLKNGRTEVPKGIDYYQNIFPNPNFEDLRVSTKDIYEEYNKTTGLPQRITNSNTDGYYGVLKFYEKGYFNFFYLKQDKVIDTLTFNSDYNGYRGLYNNFSFRMDYVLYAEATQHGDIGKLRGTFVVRGDSIFEYAKNLYAPKLYVKRSLPHLQLRETVDWE